MVRDGTKIFVLSGWDFLFMMKSSFFVALDMGFRIKEIIINNSNNLLEIRIRSGMLERGKICGRESMIMEL